MEIASTDGAKAEALSSGVHGRSRARQKDLLSCYPRAAEIH
jgi:hypothetical protein